MRILAKGMIAPAYYGHGRKWPNAEAVTVDVSDAEGEIILADPHIVGIAIPEPKHAEVTPIKVQNFHKGK